MNIKKIIVEDDNKNEIEFLIKDGCGLFITNDDSIIILPTDNSDIKLNLLKAILNN